MTPAKSPLINLYLLVILSVLVFPAKCLLANDSTRQIRTKVEVLQLVPRTLSSYSTYVGHLEPKTKVSISSEIAGVVEELNVEQGSRVKKGDILIQINTKRQLLNKQLNESNYKLALQDYERESKLLEKRLSTPAKVASLKNNLEVNHLRLKLSELDLVRSRIRAPITGIVSQPATESGEYVKVGFKMMKILDLSKVIGIINIPERDIRYIEQDEKVLISVDALPKETFEGIVKTIGLEADRQSRTFEIEILINNPETKLLPGMLTRARLLKVHLKNQLIIPQHTIQEDEHGSFVYIIKDEITVKRNITVGISVDDEVQVLKGLNFRDYLVETGQQLITSQEPVEVVSLKRQQNK